ncbi:MAG: GNAT family N-acetyltransferase [Frankiaceae bacterium]|nr:GNAT family N-acetyltransferase [Frankiaceae bacterium]
MSPSSPADYAAAPTLAGDLVRLEALRPDHRDDLAAAVAVDELWRAWYTSIPSPQRMAEEIANRIAKQRRGEIAAWAIIDAPAGRAVGMTTYLHLDPPNRRLEIGSTWLGRQAQGTGINPAAKLLLLRRAFEDLGCIAVELRTHWHNHQSREAIARLGAKQDGVLRNHAIMPNGTIRDTVVFSITDAEWPAAKAALLARLARRG